MLGKAPTPTVVAILLGFGVVFAMPFAGALAFGVDAASVPAMKDAGATPAYGQTWVGAWMRSSGWNGYETDLRTMRDNGVTPVVMWYYWGDPISQSCVQYGCHGNTKSNWDAMARDMAARGNSIMGSRTWLVVLEPEFNKNGVQDWETFDGYLADQARAIKSIAPSAKVVVGFGHWGGWDLYDRAVGASDMTGFQLLYANTRHSSGEALAAADDMVRVSKALKSRFGKDTLVFDLGVATYGGWEWVQEASLQRVAQKRADIQAAGVDVIVWRYVYDNDYSSGYFGAAESHWGVKYRWGGEKKGYDDLVTLIKGGSASTGSGSTTPAPGGTTGSFSNVKGNEWWIQAQASGSPSTVEVRVNSGAWIPMSKASWGSWTKSTYAPYGSVVELRATYAGGASTSAAYRWPDATPTSGGSAGSSTYAATFRNVKVMEWWVQTDVSANQDVGKVEARVNGGAWNTIDKQSWGAYAESMHVPAGGKVEFRAVASSGASSVSGAYWR